MKEQYLTLVYNSDPKNGYLEQYPEVEGRKVTAVFHGHAVAEMCDARELLQEIFDYSCLGNEDLEGRIEDFFTKYP